MKESFWGIFIIILGSIGIVAINLFQSLTVTTDQNYYLLKEVTKAAMSDSIDLSYYRSNPDPRAIRIVEAAFVENLTRRFAESVVLNEDYRIVIHDIVEYPPKVSLSLLSSTNDLEGKKYNILLTIDSIYEGLFNNSIITKHTPDIEEEYTIITYPEEEEIYKDGICPDSNSAINECINGDLRFEGWQDFDMPKAICPEDLDSLKAISRDAKYKECKCGKWGDIESTSIKANPVKDEKNNPKFLRKYTWIFDKKGPINNIYVEEKLDIVARDCAVEIGLECIDEGLPVKVGKSIIIFPKYKPEEATNRDLKWTRGNDRISVSDSSGDVYYPNKDYVSVTGKKSGESSVTATSTNGLTATCKINVYNKLECPTEKTTVEGGKSVYAELKDGLKLPGMKYILSDSKGNSVSYDIASIENSGLINTEKVLREENIYYTISVGSDSTTCPLKITAPPPKPETGECNAGEVKIDWGTLKTKKANVCPQMLSKFGNQAAEFIASNTSVTVTVSQCGKKGVITSDCKGDWYRETMTFKGKSINEIKGTVEVPIVYNFDNWKKEALKCKEITSTDTIPFATQNIKYTLRDSSEFICKQIDNLESIDGFVDSNAKNVEIKISNSNPSQGLKGISIEHIFTGDAISVCNTSITSSQGKFRKISNGIYSYDAPDLVKNKFDVIINCYLTQNKTDIIKRTITVVPPKDCKFNINPTTESIFFEVNKNINFDASVHPVLNGGYETSLYAAWEHKGVLKGSISGLTKTYNISGTPTKVGKITVNSIVQPQGDCMIKTGSATYNVCEVEPSCSGYYGEPLGDKCFNKDLGTSKNYCSSGTKLYGTNYCVSKTDTKTRECEKTTSGDTISLREINYLSLSTKSISWECADYKDCPKGYRGGTGSNGFDVGKCYKEESTVKCNPKEEIEGPGGKCYNAWGYIPAKMKCKE